MRQFRLAVGRWFQDVFADLRFALRRMRHQPGFTLAAATCLAIGIGANTLIFTIVDAVMLKSLPHLESERLVLVRFTPPSQGDQPSGDGERQWVLGGWSAEGLKETLGVQPMIGPLVRGNGYGTDDRAQPSSCAVDVRKHRSGTGTEPADGPPGCRVAS